MKVFIVIIITITCFFAGYLSVEPTEPNVVTYTVTDVITEMVEVPIEVPVEVLVEVPVEVPVEVIKYKVPVDFESMELLKEWLDENMLAVVVYCGASGRAEITLNHDPRYDCEDYARDLQARAYEDGYILDRQLGNHMVLMASIEGSIYFVDSFPPHSVRFITTED